MRVDLNWCRYGTQRRNSSLSSKLGWYESEKAEEMMEQNLRGESRHKNLSLQLKMSSKTRLAFEKLVTYQS